MVEKARDGRHRCVPRLGDRPASKRGLGGTAIAGVKIAPYRSGQGRVVSESENCLRFRRGVGRLQSGAASVVPQWRQDHVSTTACKASGPTGIRIAMRAVGAANGTFAIGRHALPKATRPAKRRQSGTNRRRAQGSSRPRPSRTRRSRSEPIWFAPATGKYNEGNKHFIDFQNDVTVADLELAQREGYESVELTKRYTTFGMATDQGKTSNINGLGVLAEATGKSIPEIGITTFRPPYTPFSFGVDRRARSPRTCSCRCAARRFSSGMSSNGADFEPVGQWRRAYTYPRAGEDRHGAISREILGGAQQGRAARCLDARQDRNQGAGCGGISRPHLHQHVLDAEGRAGCRYGLMMNELGFLIDDGVTVRLGEDHFLMHTTSGGADRIAAWLEEWLQTEWTHYKVFVTPVTEQWAQFAIAGPEARNVLAKLGADFDLSA